LAQHGPARAAHHPVRTSALPADTGVANLATTVIDAPPARVAQVAGDPAYFTEIFPAVEVRVLRTQGQSQLISVVRKEPWPVGMISWTEIVSRLSEKDGTLIVDREAQPGSAFFRHMRATLRIIPVPGDPLRSLIEYRVAIEISRWAPLWVLRRSNASAMVATVERLRQFCER
jgi:hypothetical protein